ncbi:hypothetical protein Dehly_0436 [Dehalogenimonas lykanthroporepellens BL-DC-9]|nr:hypothetical protein Dehly_0436 [Dehalogenimonas lykanthroporepellens BL-DC-9]
MVIALAVLMTLGAFIAIVYPFVAGSIRQPVIAGDTDLFEANYQRDHIYAQLKELENDYASGTLSREDYERLEARYRNRAVAILREIDDIQTDSPAGDDEEDIEAQIAGLRANKKTEMFCAYCGARRQSEGIFCPDCGQKFTR